MWYVIRAMSWNYPRDVGPRSGMSSMTIEERENDLDNGEKD